MTDCTWLFEEILKEKGYLLEDKAEDDYGTCEEYLKDFKEELLFQYMSPDIGERKYNKIADVTETIISNIYKDHKEDRVKIKSHRWLKRL